MALLDGFAPLAEAHDGFILDLWGVIHDGVTPYPGAIEVLEKLRLADKRVVLLSNAPRRNEAAQASMRAMGIADALYTGILTSGEAVHLHLRDRDPPFFDRLGERVFHLGPERDKNVMADLDLTEVPSPSLAEWVLNTGPDDHGGDQSVDDFEDTLAACAALDLPMVCANPDLEVIRGGRRVICAGALAARYAELGGVVRQVGKPDPAIYQRVFRLLGVRDRARTLAVGDALRTDIAGAAAVGIPSAWVLGGIHAEELGLAGDGAVDVARAARRAADAGLMPAAALRSFRW
ncbi:MAG: TIGR01459 family HAD-type hydrolase [Acetobacteraceae bacterium]|nr:TIGR01459 family HAD-type hydrolase [Acetobacteraceae bacterium]